MPTLSLPTWILAVVLDTLNCHRVDSWLIGGVNFLLRHGPHLTFDIDFWIDEWTAVAQDAAPSDAAKEAPPLSDSPPFLPPRITP